MTLPLKHILSVGECMVELAREKDGRFALSFGGDTFNTAVYLARLGANVSYLTAVGNDPYSGQIIELAKGERVGTDHIKVAKGRSAGLYLIETDNGERSFWYWRDTSPAREVFQQENLESARSAIADADIIYFSGITLSLFQPDDLDNFADALAGAKARGAKIVMDSNYRPRGWTNGKAQAREVFQRFWSMADIALPTLDDEQALWDEKSHHETVERLQGLGVTEICVKLGDKGAYVVAGSTEEHIPTEMIATPVDTTAAGDSFNAAYVAARVNGETIRDAVAIANQLAGIVVSHRGAIVPKSATESVTVQSG
ncbi:MAG: sugar kinase [Pseudomonadota bacterium]